MQKKVRRFTKSRSKIEWLNAPDIRKRVAELIDTAGIDWIKKNRIFYMRSTDANTRAYARIWGLGRVWQMALKVAPAYVIEVISEKFDKLAELEKDKVLLHELTHIPKNFSGALMPHVRRGKGNFEGKVHELIDKYLRSKNARQ